MSARELFRSAGVSSRLYKEFLEPVLLVTLFAPGEQLSAAAALGALYYYVLAHQADFDVRWCTGSIMSKFFDPWVRALKRKGLTVQSGRRVVKVEAAGSHATKVIAVNDGGHEEVYKADAVIFAVGVQAMQRVVAASEGLAARSEFNRFANLNGLDVAAVRLWLDRRVKLRNPSNVLSGFDATTGGTLFDLNALQDDYENQDKSVVEVDLYHANQILPLSDTAIVKRVLETYLAGCEPGYIGAKVVDSSVLRFKGAVTLFGPGSHQHMPSTETSMSNVFMAGDWLRQGPGAHGARGLSQEKALVTGLLAANAAASHLQLLGEPALILPVEEDEVHFQLAKNVSAASAKALKSLGATWPLL
eukprot:SM000001S04708  [mRNA]  locus=s1:1832791:1834921:+ [translate_table: standard]